MFYKIIAVSVVMGAAAAVAFEDTLAPSMIAASDIKGEGRLRVPTAPPPPSPEVPRLIDKIETLERQEGLAMLQEEESKVKAIQEFAKSTDENEDGAKKGLRGIGSVIVSEATVSLSSRV